jgi:hypothetical protein
MDDIGNTDIANRRVAEVAGMMMIGEAVVALWHPEAHCRLWRGAAGSWSHIVEWFVERPHIVRALAAAELFAGCWVALRQAPVRQ